MAFFDLHCHPSFKSALLKHDVNQCPHPNTSVQISVSSAIRLFGGKIDFGTSEDFLERIVGDSIDSQSSFSQLKGGSLVVANLVAFERGYTLIKLFNRIKQLDSRIFDEVRDEKISYNQYFTNRDWFHLRKYDDQPLDNRRYKIIRSINEYPTSPDPNIIYVIVAIEGGHNFYTGNNISEQEANPQQLVDNFERWKKQAFQQPEQWPRMLYITLTHHGKNALTNHAWAIPTSFINSRHERMKSGSFNPSGNGLNEGGQKFLRIALREGPDENRILIDIKHSSLKARRQVYQIMRNEYPDVPILATHMGLTGTSWDNPSIIEIESHQELPNVVLATYGDISGFLRNVPNSHPALADNQVKISFNPWSINLYNEDIIEIMQSKGLIGISLDRRILGAKAKQPERFSKAEFFDVWRSLKIPNFPPINQDLYPNEPLPDKFFRGNFEGKVEDLWQFCQTIIHIVLVTEFAKNQGNTIVANIDPWDHICLGSDFDGLITSIKTCRTADQLPKVFNEDLKFYLDIMANHLNVYHKKNLIKVPSDVIEKLAHKNGVDFLRKHFV